MSTFSINDNRVWALADILSRIGYAPDDFAYLTPFKDDGYREVHFIFFLTAIDHNTHGKERYQRLVNGSIVHGSELMYHQATEAAVHDPDLLTPEKLRDVPEKLLKEIFTTPEGKVPVGMTQRAALLRDAATILVEKYQADLRNLFAVTDGFLRRPDGAGILDLLRQFRAYEDPLEKKSFLLVKMLRRRERLRIKDPANLSVPVDHVLFTIALRSGIVVAEESAREAILAGRCLSSEMLKELRLTTLQAFRDVAGCSGIPVDVFDDLLWGYGRECLKSPAPCAEESLRRIHIRLDERVKTREGLRDFLRFINGLDLDAPDGLKLYPVPTFPDTWYF